MIGFGKYTTMREPELITSLTDTRLIQINPQEDGFFDTVINFNLANEDDIIENEFNFKPKYDGVNQSINSFIKAILEVKAANLEPFYRPIYDPSEDENTEYYVSKKNHMVYYQKGKAPAVGNTYNWWVETASNMPTVEGRHWHLATEYQYYAFLVWLINKLVKGGKRVETALNMVVVDSRELGNYDSKSYELTGSRCVCGVYDLANAGKLVACSNKLDAGFWVASGSIDKRSHWCPIASLEHCLMSDHLDNFSSCNFSVGLLVL